MQFHLDVFSPASSNDGTRPTFSAPSIAFDANGNRIAAELPSAPVSDAMLAVLQAAARQAGAPVSDAMLAVFQAASWQAAEEAASEERERPSRSAPSPLWIDVRSTPNQLLINVGRVEQSAKSRRRR